MKVFIISMSTVQACPRRSWLASHYRPHGPCRCVDTPASLAAKAELEEALAELRSAKRRVAEARRKLAEA